jgi:predicted phosphodiesterase
MSRILCVGDLHIPCVRSGYLQFCRDLRKEFKTDTTVFLGDIVDEHAVSPAHPASPDAPGTKEEYAQAFEAVKEWHEAFPLARVCLGNHDERPYRAAALVKLISERLKSPAELWETSGWDWQYEHTIDGIFFTHRTNNGGQMPAYNAMRARAMSVVLGHHHSCAGVKFLVNPERRLFGLDVGSGVDDRMVQFKYCQHAQQRSVISAAVILDGYPQLHVMPMSRGERYYDKRRKHGN